MDTCEHEEHPTGLEREPILDEAMFIRHAERKSVRRTLKIASAVVLFTLSLLTLGRLGWGAAIDWQSQRINEYYVPLARLMKPNCDVDTGLVLRDFPGATKQFSATRRVGTALVPAGEVRAHFFPWGGTKFDDAPYLDSIIDGRMLIQPDATPELLFFEPPVGGGDSSEIWGAIVGEDPFMDIATTARESSITRLQSAPASSIVEMAVSFDDVMTLEQLQVRLGDAVQLRWGALRIGAAYAGTDSDGREFEKGERWSFHFPGSLGVIGVPFDTVDDGAATLAEQESWQLDSLNLAEKMPWFERRALTSAREYIDENGTEYYGAVVIGSPEAALALATSPDVGTVTLGAVVMPWE